jgi:hypothetical protein
MTGASATNPAPIQKPAGSSQMLIIDLPFNAALTGEQHMPQSGSFVLLVLVQQQVKF